MSERLTVIEDLLRDILQAHYGRDVRQAIHDILAWANEEVNRIRAEWNAYRTEMNAWKAALQADWDYTKADLYSLLDHLCYVNDKTGDVVLTGNDIYMDYSDLESKTLGQCMAGTGSNLATQQINDTGDYQIVVTLGGLA